MQATINAAEWTAGKATYTTTAAHGRVAGQNITIAGCDPPEYNDTFVTVAPTAGTTVTVDMAVDPTDYVSGGTLTGPPAAAGAVTLTCKWAGVNGNDIRISLNYAGAIGGQILPPGLDLQLPPTGMLTGGTGVPDFTATINNLGETPVEYLAMPYTDDISLGDWELEFGFGDSGRWGWMRQLYGGDLPAEAA